MENFTDKPYELQKYVVVPLREPMFGHNFAIRDKWIDLAKRKKKSLLIRTPFGQEIISPQKYQSESTKFKKIYLIPDRPMTMYQRNCKLTPLQDIEKYVMDW